MKRIIVLIFVLFTAIVAMAYLYFSGLHTDKKNSDAALYAATSNASVIFSFQNDKSILDILKGQTLLKEIIGEERSASLMSLNKYLLNVPAVNRYAEKQNVHIGIMPGAQKSIEFLYATQIKPGVSLEMLVSALKSTGIRLESTGALKRLVLPDNNVFFLATKDKLVLLSGSSQVLLRALSNISEKGNRFAEYITLTSRLEKSSLAEIYINFNSFPKLLELAIPGTLNGNLSFFNSQDAFSSLAYNYSSDKILFNGNTVINSDSKNYYWLYSTSAAQKVTINNVLPYNTASYTTYTIDNYLKWRTGLTGWFDKQHQTKKTKGVLAKINNEYHLDLEHVFPKYFKDQLITFQLSTSENLGAINLSNGEKFEQQLLDISTDVVEGIKQFREPDLLFCYFGEPFKKFRKPHYVIIDNYMVFANNLSTVRSFLNSYRNNELLIGDADYINSLNQLPNSSGITFFIDLKNSDNILLKNLRLPYYHQIRSEDGLRAYRSLTYQLSAEQGKFQTNVLLSKKATVSKTDSMEKNIDSLPPPL